MNCPSCKRENPPHALRCAYCAEALTPAEAAKTARIPNSQVPPARSEYDRTIEGRAPSARSRPHENPGVSTLSKTPSGSVPTPGQGAEDSDMVTLPGAAGTPRSTGGGARASVPGGFAA